MSNTPEKTPDDGGINQSDIDALFGGGAEEANPPADSANAADTSRQPEGGSFDQSDIDALLSGGGSAANEQPTGEISQDDIDALQGAASTEGSADANARSSSEPDTRLDSLGRPFDEVAAAMQAALEEEGVASPPPTASPPPPPPTGSSPYDLPAFDGSLPADIDAKKVTMLNDVNLNVRIELGRTRMLVEDVLRLNEGSVVELDKLAGDPVDVFANGRLVARGEVLVLNDSFCVRVSEVFARDPHRVVQ